MDKNKGKKIAVCGNHSTTIDTAKSLIEAGYRLDLIINMKNDLGGKIAGYVNSGRFARENTIPIYRPHSYSLKDERDQKYLTKKKLDLLIAFGWQRLIPDWFLESLSIGAFGTHGSSKRLPKGRGRSVINWSLLTYESKIIDNLFKYDVGVDSGEIVESQSFSINTWDTTLSVHHKDQMVQKLLLLDYLPKILKNNFSRKPQSRIIKATYYPKRTPEDGVIDWNWETKWIFGLIRAVTKPYPGAYTFHGATKIMIWEATPFENFPQLQNKRAGEILEAFYDGTFVVKTKDGSLLVLDYEANWRPKKGMRLKSQPNQSFAKLKEVGLWK